MLYVHNRKKRPCQDRKMADRAKAVYVSETSIYNTTMTLVFTQEHFGAIKCWY